MLSNLIAFRSMNPDFYVFQPDSLSLDFYVCVSSVLLFSIVFNALRSLKLDFNLFEPDYNLYAESIFSMFSNLIPM
jgi:hypothetical protein